MTSIAKIASDNSGNRLGSFLLPIEMLGFSPEMFDLFQRVVPCLMRKTECGNFIHVAAISSSFDEYVPVSGTFVPEYTVTFRGGRVDSIKRTTALSGPTYEVA
jgi:hypothetical protein